MIIIFRQTERIVVEVTAKELYLLLYTNAFRTISLSPLEMTFYCLYSKLL